MQIVVLSRDLPQSWEKLTPFKFENLDGAIVFDYHGSPAYVLALNCASKAEAAILESEAQDPNTPFFEWDTCTIEKQVNQPGAIW